MRNIKSGLPITFNTPTLEASVHVGSPIGIGSKSYLNWSSGHFHKHFQAPGQLSVVCSIWH